MKRPCEEGQGLQGLPVFHPAGESETEADRRFAADPTETAGTSLIDFIHQFKSSLHQGTSFVIVIPFLRQPDRILIVHGSILPARIVP